jgi:acetyl esterase/lipase
MLRLLSIIFLSLSINYFGFCQNEKYIIEQNIPYYENEVTDVDIYKSERCLLDIYYPKDNSDFASVIWFHGGGLRGGEKEIPQSLKEKGLCVIAVNYRLYPQVNSPTYIEDAAAAVAWVFNNIANYGGDTSLIFLSGHSAGGYLTSMIGLDKKWLSVHSIDANNIAGLIPFSGHCITHFTVREENGIKGTQPIIDDMAPLYHIRADAPPLLLITGDRNLELLGRYEENAYMMRMMNVIGHNTRIIELQGYDHNMAEPAFPLLIKEVERIKELTLSK